MADLGDTFDPTAVPERERNFDPVPAGNYDAQIVESEVADTKNRDGKILKLTWEIIAGPYERRKVFQNLNISNKSAQAQEIAHRDLADICEATGVGAVRDSVDLHHRPATIRVAIEKSEQYGDKNVVKGTKAIGGGATVTPMRAAPAPARSAPAPAAPPARAAAGSRPWGART